ncbi:MAG: hypothetical protein Q9183_001624 [Haloplaca sp. 2 TL-2023]
MPPKVPISFSPLRSFISSTLALCSSCQPKHPAEQVNLDQLDKTKITGDKNVDAIQDGVNNGVSGQFKEGGLLGGVGDLVSKEGVNRAERGDTGLGEKQAMEKGQEQKKGWGDSIPGSSYVTGKK